jgi:hypothetical protein
MFGLALLLGILLHLAPVLHNIVFYILIETLGVL